jgi:hypothetical protein
MILWTRVRIEVPTVDGRSTMEYIEGQTLDELMLPRAFARS